MTNPFPKRRRGQKTQFTAAGVNAMADAARAERMRSTSRERSRLMPAELAGTILVRNDTTVDVPRFGVLAVGEPVILPEDNEDDFFTRPCLKGGIPQPELPNFVVTLEPIPVGQIGRGMLAGVTPAQVLVFDEDSEFRFATADPSAGVDGLVLAEGGQAEVIWKEPGTGLRRALVRIGNTPSSGVGALYLAIVVSPSSNGSSVASWTVDIYGADVDSLSVAPTLTAETAVQEPGQNIYYRGEVVTVQQVGDGWQIGKFLASSQAYSVEALQICLRVAPAAASDTAAAGEPTNFLVDLADCLDHFDGGANGDRAWIVFRYGTYGGFGTIRTTESIPVRYQSGWNLATIDSFQTSSLAARNVLMSGSPSSVASVQDTVAIMGSSPSSNSVAGTWSGTASLTPGAYIAFLYGQPFVTEVRSLDAEVQYLFSGTDDADAWTALPTLPTITGGVDSDQIILGRYSAFIAVNSTIVPGSGPATKLDPFVRARFPVAAGGSAITQTYSFDITANALSGGLTVS